MKKYFFPLLAILTLPIVMISCKDDEEEVYYSEDCYISSLSLGAMKRTLYVTGHDGLDSAYTVSFTSTFFPMTIDQRRQTIENLDSLPVRTRLNAVLVSASFQGLLVWRKANLAADADTTWQNYSSSDSLDLREPLHFRVISVTGLSSRTYTLKVNVHQQDADSTHWDSLGFVEPLKAMGERKALVWNNKVTILGKLADGTISLVQHPCTTTGEWSGSATTGTQQAVPGTVQQLGGALYMSTTEGRLITSSDGTTWTQANAPALTGLTLVDASDDYLYALAGNKLYRGNGENWEEETLEDAGENLPTSQLNGIYYTMKNGLKRLVLVGGKEGDKEATVWAKSWQEGKEAKESWIYYAPNDADKNRCPLMDNLCVLPYDDGIQALGGKSADGKYEALGSILHSNDHGITWKTYTNYDMKADPWQKKAASTAQYITAAVDGQSFLWVFVDDQVWRGRINRLGFLRK